MRIFHRRPTAAALAALAALPLAAIAMATSASAGAGSCKTTKTEYRVATAGETTTSTDFTRLPKTRVDFKQGGKSAGCVIVRFSGVPRADYIMIVRAVLDGQKIAKPDNIELEYDSPGYLSPRGFEFVLPKVSPGKHWIAIEWKTATMPANISQMYERVITVMHR